MSWFPKILPNVVAHSTVAPAAFAMGDVLAHDVAHVLWEFYTARKPGCASLDAELWMTMNRSRNGYRLTTVEAASAIHCRCGT